MKFELPLRHRAVLAVVLFVFASVEGAWVSRLIGDQDPTVWGFAIGSLCGLALAVAVLLHGGRPHRSSRAIPP